jgi:hypothetical protein
MAWEDVRFKQGERWETTVKVGISQFLDSVDSAGFG